MITYTLGLLRKLDLAETVVVVGYQAAEVKKVVGAGYKFAVQTKQLGTGHAVATGLSKVSPKIKNILVINGDDSAFYKPETIQKVLRKHIGKGSTVTFVSLQLADPTSLGRVIRHGKKVIGIIEEKAASSAQKKIKEVNDGVYVFRRAWLAENLPKIKKSPVGEYYIVDLIGLAVQQEEPIAVFKLADTSEWKGVNTPEELAAADKLMRERLKNVSQK
jgi:bifunctional UDP-N-acetylglucosamine pyrophosphorylase/glucosamine-1-phosphate N-acetyltransferase